MSIYKWNGSCPEDEDENKDEYVPFEVFSVTINRLILLSLTKVLLKVV